MIRLLLISFLLIYQLSPSLAKGMESRMALAKKKQRHLRIGDTLGAINVIIEMAGRSSAEGNYSDSYDGYWEALILSNKISDSSLVPRIYMKLAVLYSIYGRMQDAESYFYASLHLQKNRPELGKDQQNELCSTYFLLASHYREHHNYGMAQQYLDSCWRIRREYFPGVKAPYMETAQGFLKYFQGEYQKALELLLPMESYFAEKSPSYVGIIAMFLGDVYYAQGDLEQSEPYYLKSIQVASTHGGHPNYLPNIHEKLGKLYYAKGEMKLAYQHLQQSKHLSEELFSAKSKINSSIFEIKDAYRIEKESQQQMLKAARLHELEQSQKILFLRNGILSISIASLLLIASILIWQQHKRQKSERLSFLNKQQLSEEKNAEILEIKNKELIASALQLIQKDELILEIKERLSSTRNISNHEISQILSRIKLGKSQDWTEFNARFISINKSFYQTLTNRYPQLTQRDHRLCALIKLNFSSKEISQLLGISDKSVNTSRYRLRKKMALAKDEDLSEVISRI